jgi:hypothetical protein
MHESARVILGSVCLLEMSDPSLVPTGRQLLVRSYREVKYNPIIIKTTPASLEPVRGSLNSK